MCCQCSQKHPLVIIIVIIEGLPNLVFGLPLVGRLLLTGKQTQVFAFQQIPQLSHESGHQNNSISCLVFRCSKCEENRHQPQHSVTKKNLQKRKTSFSPFSPHMKTPLVWVTSPLPVTWWLSGQSGDLGGCGHHWWVRAALSGLTWDSSIGRITIRGSTDNMDERLILWVKLSFLRFNWYWNPSMGNHN